MLDKTNVPARDGLAHSPKDAAAVNYLHNAEAPRINTDSLILSSLEQLYPEQRITIVPEQSCNFLAFAAAGHAIALPDPDTNATASGPLEWLIYVAPASRLDGSPGVVASSVRFGKYKFSWRDFDFVLYLVEGRDGTGAYPVVRNNYLISPTADAATAESVTRELILAAGEYGVALHREIWVFDQSSWRKDASLWASIQDARWENVILDPDMKKAIIGDVNRFYDGRAKYGKLKVPWKRGIIYHGPPGNGKTISIKATMNMLSRRKDPVPTLYVKTLSGYVKQALCLARQQDHKEQNLIRCRYAPPEYALDQIFLKARATAPCYLVFEDLDSIVDETVRSFFLNQVDGLSNNNGILMIGSTNHLELLDPGISKRPSRFDRKYLFPNPSFEERITYAEFWRNKLLKEDSDEKSGQNPDSGGSTNEPDEKLEFPKEMCRAVAGITDGFSFAYIQEAFVAALLTIASEQDEIEAALEGTEHARHKKPDGHELDRLPLWRELKRQVKILREDLNASGWR
jgi:hypothetical protein